jgi:hypothetical protein
VPTKAKSTKLPRTRNDESRSHEFKARNDEARRQEEHAILLAGGPELWRLKHGAALRAADALSRAIRVSVETPNGPLLLFPFQKALGEGCDTTDRGNRAAYEMAMTGIIALVTKDPGRMATVRAWDAHRRRVDPERGAVDILEIRDAVAVAVHFHKHRDDPPYPPPYRGGKPYEKLAQDGPKNLRERLAARFGESVPNVDDLTDWIGRHANKSVRGKLTTAGIVARIVHRGQLLGARGTDEQKTLERVTKVLTRHTGRPTSAAPEQRASRRPRGRKRPRSRRGRADTPPAPPRTRIPRR